MENCPNCKAVIKKGLLGSNTLITTEMLSFVNEFKPSKVEAICEKCSANEVQLAVKLSRQEIDETTQRFKDMLRSIPIVSAQSPPDWVYQTIGIVTAQSVIGTGISSELTSSISDLLGRESEGMNRKIRTGEDLCFERLRRRCAEIGGNAILAVDIDYNEAGGLKGMIMVCMTGTAVRQNPDASDYWSTDYKKDIARVNKLQAMRYPYATPTQ